ncbi:hypothetical protein RJ641_033903 [Dillenia turbinata]|uniref:Uncharacterized protein n=1 Tax=Dillenia turbinata TaxID=194707 RepID=A0AAN8ZJY8_9MAGN
MEQYPATKESVSILRFQRRWSSNADGDGRQDRGARRDRAAAGRHTIHEGSKGKELRPSENSIDHDNKMISGRRLRRITTVKIVTSVH